MATADGGVQVASQYGQLHEAFDGAIVANISVVIPVFNAAPYLTEAIESAWQQARPPLEVLAVDDGSTDDSANLAAKAGARVLATTRNLGPGGARNVGIRAAAGDFVAFLDADDRWRPAHLASVAEALNRHSEAVLACAGLEAFGACTYQYLPSEPWDTPVDCRIALAVRNPVPQSTAIVRRDAIVRAGCYDTPMRYAEDFDLWQRLSRLGRFVFLGEITADYRFHAGQSSRARLNMLQGGWTVRRRAWDELHAILPARDLDELRLQLTAEWEKELRAAWSERSSDAIRFVLAQGGWVPDSAAIFRRWSWKLRLLRPFWRGATHVVDSLRKLRHPGTRAPHPAS